MSDLLEEFIAEECTESVPAMLLSDIEEQSKNGVAQFKEYTFNRFNVYLNFIENEVRIEDDLDPEESGVLIVSLDSFVEAINKKNRDQGG